MPLQGGPLCLGGLIKQLRLALSLPSFCHSLPSAVIPGLIHNIHLSAFLHPSLDILALGALPGLSAWGPGLE